MLSSKGHCCSYRLEIAFESIRMSPRPSFRPSSCRYIFRNLQSQLSFTSSISESSAGSAHTLSILRHPQQPPQYRSLATVSAMPVPSAKVDVTVEVGGQRNVDKLLAISRDFRSEQKYPSYSNHHPKDLRKRIDDAFVFLPRCAASD